MHEERAQSIVYVDRSRIRDGAVEELEKAIGDLVDFIDASEPQILAYSIYLSDDRSEMTVVHVHADASSLDYHMEVAGPAFRRFTHLVELLSIHVYGEPSQKALEQLHAKASMLGSGDVIVQPPRAGLSRLGRS